MTQQLKSKLGEVAFRKKLTDQHIGKKQHFEGEPDKSQIISVLRERVVNSRKIFRDLKKKGVTISPFLEIGAEKGQRAALLTSEFGAQGFALDISYESLRSLKYFAKKLHLKKVPILICADAENLPLANNSIPFVFAFQTLHHFPTPKKAITEMQRVSSQTIYFSEEPVAQTFNLGLWKRNFNLTNIEKILKSFLILPFLSKLGGTEDKYDILENEFTIETWQKSLSSIDQAEIMIEPVFWGPKSTFENFCWNINPITRALTAIEGGGITVLSSARHSGLSRIPHRVNDSGVAPLPRMTNLFNLLACPLCHKSNLKKSEKELICISCKSTYPIKSGVFIMLPPALRKKLYPAF